MGVISKINKLSSLLFFRKRKVKKMQKKLENEGFTLISSNCIGGLLYHDLKHEFLSPTINLYFNSPVEFIKFCENLNYYISLDMTEVENNKYPIVQLGDIKLHMVHYKSFEEAKNKWDERKKRINFDKIFIIFTDRNGFHEELLGRFDKLNYKKVFFSHTDIKEFNWICYVNEFKKSSCVGDLTTYANIFGDKFYEKHFNFIKWLNGAETKECLK